jgi:hypothetical protein
VTRPEAEEAADLLGALRRAARRHHALELAEHRGRVDRRRELPRPCLAAAAERPGRAVGELIALREHGRGRVAGGGVDRPAAVHGRDPVAAQTVDAPRHHVERHRVALAGGPVLDLQRR